MKVSTILALAPAMALAMPAAGISPATIPSLINDIPTSSISPSGNTFISTDRLVIYTAADNAKPLTSRPLTPSESALIAPIEALSHDWTVSHENGHAGADSEGVTEVIEQVRGMIEGGAKAQDNCHAGACYLNSDCHGVCSHCVYLGWFPFGMCMRPE